MGMIQGYNMRPASSLERNLNTTTSQQEIYEDNQMTASASVIRKEKKTKRRKAGEKQGKEKFKKLPPLTKTSLEPVREKIGKFAQSLPAERRIEHKYVMKVKGKCLNSFLGIIKSDLARLAVEGFPQDLNKKLAGLMLLPR